MLSAQPDFVDESGRLSAVVRLEGACLAALRSGGGTAVAVPSDRDLPGRHQCFWLLTAAMSPTEAEELYKCLTFLVGADELSWDLGQILHVAGSWNFKREPPHRTRVVWWTGRRYDLAELDRLLPPLAEQRHPRHRCLRLRSGLSEAD